MRKRNLRRMESQPLYCGECNQLIRPEERTGRIFHTALAYQRRHKEMGLCTRCPKKAFKAGMCKKHYGMKRQRMLEKRAS